MARGLYTTTWRILVLVSMQDFDNSQYSLDEYLEPSGPKSFAGILWNATWTGFPRFSLGLPDTTHGFPHLEAYGGQWDSVGIDHIGAELTMDVTTRADSGEG